MKAHFPFRACLSLALIFAGVARSQEAGPTPTEVLVQAITEVVRLIEPGRDLQPKTLSTRLELVSREGLPKGLSIEGVTLAFQAPDRLQLRATVSGKDYAVGRNGQEVWAHVAGKKWGLVAKPGVPRFAGRTNDNDTTNLRRFKSPLPMEQLALVPLLVNIETLPAETNENVRCQVLLISPKPGAIEALRIPNGTLTLAIRETDFLPARIAWKDGKGLDVSVQTRDLKLTDPWSAEKWSIPAAPDDLIETTALAHVARFIPVALAKLKEKIPTLGPATGECRLIATEGEGRLEMRDGTRVLFLKGTPEEMGHQHGVLLRKEIKDLVDHILYGVGVGSSIAKGRWFFGEIESAEARLAKHMDPRYLREMDATAAAAGLPKEELRLANYFPELFHCSGFALFGDATQGGKIYHGRVLDYLKGMGLEQNAVVMVFQPDQGNAWVNLSYAGFIGSVTAMNEKHLSIGEMGGRGEGNWDGKPMAQLVREVMEKADTIEQAIEIFRRGPRTCEYFYVVADAKTKRAAGIAATPEKLEVVWAGESHPRLPHAVKDAVILSAGDRYEKLVERIQAGYGKFTADTARDLMTRPVCMPSNIHSVLFDPESLDFWVANADSKNVASDTRYTHYNLNELLKRSACSK